MDSSDRVTSNHKVWLSLTMLGLGLPTLVTWIYFDLLSSASPALQQVAYSLGKAIQFALPLVAWRYFTCKVFSDGPASWGMARKSTSGVTSEAAQVQAVERSPVKFRASLWWGLGSGLAIAATILGVYHFLLIPSGLAEGAIAAAREKIASMGLKSQGVFLGVALFYSLCHSGLEEYYWRWFVFRHLAARQRLAWAVALSSLGFMAHHVLVLARYFGWTSPLTYGLSLGVATGGVIWAVMYKRWGTLLGPWLSHAAVDAAIFVIAWQMIDWDG